MSNGGKAVAVREKVGCWRAAGPVGVENYRTWGGELERQEVEDGEMGIETEVGEGVPLWKRPGKGVIMGTSDWDWRGGKQGSLLPGDGIL